MLIRCNIPEADNIVKFGPITYHFKKNEHGHLVCNVEDDAARDFFLRQKAFSLYTCEEEGGAPAQPQEEAPRMSRAWLESRTAEELQTLFKARFGKLPHPYTKHETLVEKLAEA